MQVITKQFTGFFTELVIFFVFRLSNSASFSELQYLASRRAAAVAASILPPSTSNETTIPPPPSHQHDFHHPAYRIPGYMEHLYSLQHATNPSASLHGNDLLIYLFFTIFVGLLILTIMGGAMTVFKPITRPPLHPEITYIHF